MLNTVGSSSTAKQRSVPPAAQGAQADLAEAEEREGGVFGDRRTGCLVVGDVVGEIVEARVMNDYRSDIRYIPADQKRLVVWDI